MKPLSRLLVLVGLVLSAFLGAPLAAQTGGQNHIASELVTEGPARPGDTVELAFHFRPEERWHGYWSNPGDAGYGMSLDWQLPEGWTAGTPSYPVPEMLVIKGLMNHVYEGDYAVLVPLTVPADASGTIPVSVEAQWLACTDEICVPERATLTTSVVIGEQAQADPRFDGWRAAIPPLIDSKGAFQIAGQSLRIAIPLPGSMEISSPHIFMANERLVDYAGAQRFWRDGDRLIAELPIKGAPIQPEQISGILKLGSGSNGVSFEAGAGAVAVGGTPLGDSASGAPLWALLGGALLGGLLLNIMPCVFPILSLKALSLARAGESEAGARREGLAYTAGVILAVLALGGLLLALRAAGTEVGWAFQLQEPGVVVVLLALALAITANLWGLYELPSFSLTRKGESSGAFATGLLAAFVATPCTGPFMAAAMGAALLLPVPQALLLFATLGLGLALPFLLLGWVPALRKMLPRPGAWMNRFKKAMAIPMGLTALALVWLSMRLGGWQFALGAIAIGVLFTTFLIFEFRSRMAERRAMAVLASLLVVPALIGLFVLPRIYSAESREGDATLLQTVPFSEAALADARASGRPVFAYFTADWCLTCKVNENVAIEREATRAAFEKAGVVTLVGDWTQRDPAITRFLTSQGAAGVPLYLWYPANGEASKLDQVLTPDTLVTLAREAEGQGQAQRTARASGTR